jgi:hypothetical protein
MLSGQGGLLHLPKPGPQGLDIFLVPAKKSKGVFGASIKRYYASFK